MSTATKTKKPSRILADAAKWIEEHGLAKGTFFKYRNHHTFPFLGGDEGVVKAKEKGCRACAMGAIYIANGSDLGVPRDVFRYLESATGTSYIPSWNDRKKRTQAEVVDAFKKAAKAARKDGK